MKRKHEDCIVMEWNNAKLGLQIRNEDEIRIQKQTDSHVREISIIFIQEQMPPARLGDASGNYIERHALRLLNKHCDKDR